MKPLVAAGIPVAMLASALALASRPAAAKSAPNPEAEALRVRETQNRLIQKLAERLESIDARLADAEKDRSKQQELLADLAAETRGADGSLKALRDTVASLCRDGSREAAALGRSILHPSVQVTARGGVGGGTLVRSEPEEGERCGSYVLTAFHVVQKAADKDDPGTIRVRLYRESGAPSEQVDAELLLSDERRDLALLKLKSERRYPFAARLATRDRIRDTAVFTPIYAVGCPLGHDPLPTSGEITTLRKDVNGERFWMMNAPTIFGNSGGGVFHRETMEMLGVSAMICTFENPVTTPVPHLGILVPMDAVADWLRANHYGYLVDPGLTKAECDRRRAAAAATPASAR